MISQSEWIPASFLAVALFTSNLAQADTVVSTFGPGLTYKTNTGKTNPGWNTGLMLLGT
jgi:hypothetical protein